MGMKKEFWNPWHGCHKCSPGCLHCYVYYLDGLREVDASVVRKSKSNFHLPLKRDRKGNFKIEPGSEVATCFTSDFFLPEADAWRSEAWEVIRQRPDVTFLICTKRIERFLDCIPKDWGMGYENVILAVTCENQVKCEERLPILLSIPAKCKYVFVAPILEYVDLKPFFHIGGIDRVSVGGESYQDARLCDFVWVSKIYEDCKNCGVAFDFHQTGSNFLFQGKRYRISHFQEYSQAKKAMQYLKEMSKN